MEPIKWVENRMPKSEDRQMPVMSLENVAKARRFHSSFPQYAVTPLAQLKAMAAQLGLGDLFVKDESYRFGLDALKCWAARLPWPGMWPSSWGGMCRRSPMTT